MCATEVWNCHIQMKLSVPSRCVTPRLHCRRQSTLGTWELQNCHLYLLIACWLQLPVHWLRADYYHPSESSRRTALSSRKCRWNTSWVGERAAELATIIGRQFPSGFVDSLSNRTVIWKLCPLTAHVVRIYCIYSKTSGSFQFMFRHNPCLAWHSFFKQVVRQCLGSRQTLDLLMIP